MKQHMVELTLPEEVSLITGQLTVITHVREDGTQGYSVHARGDMPMISYLGMTVVAQEEIKKWGQEG